MLKKFLALLLFLLLTFCMIPTTTMAADGECEMDGIPYVTLSEALAMVGSGESKTIKILKNIDYDGEITIDGRAVTLDLNGFAVNINNTAAESTGLIVMGNGTLDIAGSGSLNVSGTGFGVYVYRGSATVTNATSQMNACYAIASGSSITVKGNATSNDSNSQCVSAYLNATVVIEGDVLSRGSGTFALRSGHIIVNGSVVAENGLGAYSDEHASIVIRGNVSGSSVGVNACADGATVTVDGIITAPTVIVVYYSERTLDDFNEVGTGVFADYLLYKNGSSCVYVKNHPEVTPASATFDKNGGTDVALAIKPYGATLVDIYNDMTALTAGTEYTVSGNTVTLSAGYLDDQSLGSYELKLDFSTGVDPVVTVNIVNTTVITGIPATETVYVGRKLTLEPLPSGGTWQWDSEYFSDSLSGPTTFTALKDGISTITYTVGGVSTTSIVTIGKALTLTVSPSDGMINVGGRFMITPNIEGGTWSYEVSSLTREGNEFIGVMAGRTRIVYAVGEQSAYVDVSILAVLTVDSMTATSVNLTTIPGAEYRINSEVWQSSPLFTGLEPNTEYTFYVRLAATTTTLV